MFTGSTLSVGNSSRKSARYDCSNCCGRCDCETDPGLKSNSVYNSMNVYRTGSFNTSKKSGCKVHQCEKKSFKSHAHTGCHVPKVYIAPKLRPLKLGQRIPVTAPVRNLDAGSRRDYKILRQEEVLYQKENHDDNEVRISREDFDLLVERAKRFSVSDDEGRRERTCTELNYPQFNSTGRTRKKLQDAIKNLQDLPKQVEYKVRTDDALKKRVDDVVTKTLNVPSKSSLYKNLVSVESAEDERVRSLEQVKKNLTANLPPPKKREDGPNILDFNKPTFARIKPKLPDPPSISDVETGATLEPDLDYEIIGIRKKVMKEVGSNASVLSRPSTKSNSVERRES